MYKILLEFSLLFIGSLVIFVGCGSNTKQKPLQKEVQKQEIEKKQEIVKQETVKNEIPKQYTIKQEKPNQDITKQEPIKKIINRNRAAILLPKEHISLTVGIKERFILPNGKQATWSSNSDFVKVDQNGTIYAQEDKLGNESQAIITAIPIDGSDEVRTNITIVNWNSNFSSLAIELTPDGIGELITKDGSTLYTSAGPNLYSSTDGLKTKSRVGDFPSAEIQTPVIIKTPYSHYLRVDNKIFETNNYVDYSEILTTQPSGQATEHPGLNHMFAYDVDSGYIYAGEYTLARDNRHSVYRGKVNNLGLKEWKKIFEFDSVNENSVNSVYHIHTVVVDPYTGNVWIGTGDSDSESRLYYSDDHGESFKLFAIGAQYYRILSMWFTKDYIYWNTDSDTEKQVISRVKRSDMVDHELTPRLESGQTKEGVKYYVYKSDGSLPSGVGNTYIETNPHTLNKENIVYAVDDPEFNYRKIVAELENGSHWYHLWVKDNKGEDLLLMNAAAEGEKRDKRGRVFGLKEREDGSVDVQELLSISPATDRATSHYVQLVPSFQDDEGYIYFRGRETKHMIYKTKLQWRDY